jgi:hypothetical protein
VTASRRKRPDRDRSPRLSPPPPTRSLIRDFEAAAKEAAFSPLPHQRIAATYITATKRGRWLYPEVADIEPRQNGKSSKLIPLIVSRLAMGSKVMHTAQNRALPREVFLEVANVMRLRYHSILDGMPRLANGQEIIRTKGGGLYRIVAPTSGGARGPANDLVIVDEVREFTDWEFIGAARATLTASANPQMLYLSNAGDEGSVVLNALRARADADPGLAYLEWSADPELEASDRKGWAQANPALGLTIRADFLESQFRLYELEERLDIFETEHLCRWVRVAGRRVVSDISWDRARVPTLEAPRSPVLGVAVSPTRASAVVAWLASDNSVALTLAMDLQGNPLDVEAAGRELKAYAQAMRIRAVGYSPQTDRDLMRYVEKGKPLNQADLAAASARFASTVEGGRLRWSGAEPVSSDLPYLIRKEGLGSWIAEPAGRDRIPTAALAAIRAVYLATEPRARPRIH